MAISSSEEIRGFSTRLVSMVDSVESELESLAQAVRGVGGGWSDDAYTDFSTEMEALCRKLEPFYEDARQYAQRLNTKADLVDTEAAHKVSR